MWIWIERLLKVSRGLSFLRKLLICGLLIVSTQSVPADSAENACSVARDTKGVFTRRDMSGPDIVARFIDLPRSDAGVDAVRRHFVYESILGRIASLRLSDATSRSCNFTYKLYGSLDLYFAPLDFARPGFNECSLSKCAASLVELLQSMTIERSAFSQVVAEGVQFMSEPENEVPNSLYDGQRLATVEAYRHIYEGGTHAHTLLSLRAEDFGSADYNDFQRWFGRQQALLQQRVETSPGVDDVLRSATSPSSQDGSKDCQKTEVKVRELGINHHGWGHQSILLIKHGFHASGADGIDNAVLRAFCPPHAGSAKILDSEPWLEMTGRISCSRESVDRDHWLILASEKRPVATSIEMKRYAQAVAEVLSEQGCVRPDMDMILVNFLPQN